MKLKILMYCRVHPARNGISYFGLLEQAALPPGRGAVNKRLAL